MNATDDAALIEECARRSLAPLHENLGPHGFRAARPSDRAVARGYDRVFGRDGALCAIAAARSGDRTLIRGARRTLAALAAHQAANGQIPKFVEPEAQRGDFWYLGCIDAALWWLIAIKLVDQSGGGRLERRLQARIRRALAWLGCQEHPLIHLLQQNETSDWADIMPRSGFVLYTNALWLYVKKLYRLPGSHLPDCRRLGLLIHYARRRSRIPEQFLSYVDLSFWGEEGDVLGNLLALLLGMADGERRQQVLDAVAARPTAHAGLSVLKPIQPDSREWRPYMERHRQNLPHRYHNGGLWPMVGGFWVLARLARANAAGNWRFTEWFDGASGTAEGMAGQSWNAALFLLVCAGLDHEIF